MHSDELLKSSLLDAHAFALVFDPVQQTLSSVENARVVPPMGAECARAVANIREWRRYLPEACVSIMIDKGWQWST